RRVPTRPVVLAVGTFFVKSYLYGKDGAPPSPLLRVPREEEVEEEADIALHCRRRAGHPAPGGHRRKGDSGARTLRRHQVTRERGGGETGVRGGGGGGGGADVVEATSGPSTS
ncbi:unnamed protein product, partial [Prorocentrum cordatum]